MAYDVKVLADSISPAGHRITTFEVTFPRIILAEVNTHCALSRNSASSRAIPVPKRIAAVSTDPFVPESFGRNQKGMQPGDALEGDEADRAAALWESARVDSIRVAGALSELGVHKQYANRLLEPHAWHTAVITATDWDNFEHLRVNPMAQGEFQKVAAMMMQARAARKPEPFEEYDVWHTPYVNMEEVHDLEAAGIDPVKVSVARCARVSYLTQYGRRDPLEDVALFDKLVGSGHMSPLEHVARPTAPYELAMTKAWDVALEISGKIGPALRVRWENAPFVGRELVLGDGRHAKVASVRGPLHYCGKLNGWISRRAYVPGEYDILGYRNEVAS